MKRKIKILYLITTFSVGGAEMHLLSLVSGLDKEKYNIVVAFLKEEAGEARSLVRDFSVLGVKIVDLKMVSLFNIGGLWRLAKLIRKERPDILHTHLYRSDLAGAFIGKLFSVPIIISTVHNEEPFLRNLFLSFLNRLSSKIDDKVIVISDSVGRYMMKVVGIHPSKIKRIYYGLKIGEVVDEKNNELRKEYQINSKTPLIGTIGRLAPQKGHKYLIEAMHKITQFIPNAELVVVGHDEWGLKKELEALSFQLGLSRNVIFTGFRSDVEAIMKSLDLLVLPSLWEGFGLVLLEAMAASKPIVATRVSAIPEIVIDGETGLLVPPKDSNALAEAIIKLLKNPKLAAEMGRKGRERLEKKFSLEKMIKETEALYDLVVREKLGSRSGYF